MRLALYLSPDLPTDSAEEPFFLSALLYIEPAVADADHAALIVPGDLPTE